MKYIVTALIAFAGGILLGLYFSQSNTRQINDEFKSTIQSQIEKINYLEQEQSKLISSYENQLKQRTEIIETPDGTKHTVIETEQATTKVEEKVIIQEKVVTVVEEKVVEVIVERIIETCPQMRRNTLSISYIPQVNIETLSFGLGVIQANYEFNTGMLFISPFVNYNLDTTKWGLGVEMGVRF